MAWQYHPLLILFLMGGLVSLLVAGYSLYYGRTYGWTYLAAGIGLLGFNHAVWVFAATLKTASTDLATSLWFYKLEFLGILPNTAVGIAVALAYIGKDRWLTRRVWALLSLAPIIFLVLVLVNPNQAMIADPTMLPAQGIMAFEHEFPPLFDLYLAYLYGTGLLVILILARGVMTGRVPRTPTLAAILALLLPFGTAILKTADIYPAGGTGINITPAASAVGISILAVAIGRYRVFDLIPVGRDQAIEEMADGYLLVGPNRRILDANPEAASLLGVTSSTELKTKRVQAVMPQAEVLTEPNPVDLEIEDRTIEVRRSELTRQRQHAGDVLLLHDVTEKRRRERELERTNERLDQFASVVTHDLRNPLNLAQGRLRLARGQSDNQHLEGVEYALDRMSDIVENTLALAREGDIVGETKPIDLGDYVDSCWRNVETMDADLVIEENLTVQADPNRSRRLFENLFRNAVEHGGEDVTVRVGPIDDSGFYVADNGPGIPPEQREIVFEPGQTMAPDGTGFGLAIVEQIAEAHGWDVSVGESESGGARFEITGVQVAA